MKTTTTVAEQIARSLQAMRSCADNGNMTWEHNHLDTIDSIVSNGPSGSGWDIGTKLCYDTSKPEELVFYGSFHHMDDGGGYDGWTDHNITVKSSLVFGLDIEISGDDRNDIKDYLHEMFDVWLTEECHLNAKSSN